MRSARLVGFVILGFFVGVAGARADAIGYSWDSSGACSAETIVSGTPCVLNDAAISNAIAAGTPTLGIDLADDGAVTAGWEGSVGGVYAFDFLAEFTARWATNEFGWATPTRSGVIFGAADGAGTHAVVEIPQGAFFYYRNAALGDYYESLLQPIQFQAWHRGEANFIGVEDIAASPFGRNDWDYNDMVMRVERTPEPSSLLLVGAGCLALARRLRRPR